MSEDELGHDGGAGHGVDAVEPLSEHEDVASYVAGDVRVREVKWAWKGYIPAGKLSLVEGDPGDGKSILTIDLAARWSTGAGPWP